MAARFDSFGLQELTAKPEDAFRLTSLIMTEGQRVQGYAGDYYRYYMGDAMAVVRTMIDPDSGEELLLGMDTHAVSKCVWECRVDRDLTPQTADPLFRRLLVSSGDGEDTAVVDVLCAEVLPKIETGGTVRLNMAGFPLRVDYSGGECKGVVSAQEDTVLLQGVVTDAKVGESYLGMEPLTKFLSVTVKTPMGELELCHPMDMVKESQQDCVKPGAVVSALCHLSGDAAAGEFAGGIVFSTENCLAVLQEFFRSGRLLRLRPVLRSDCVCTFLENRQEGEENALALLDLVSQQMKDAGFGTCVQGMLTGVEQADPPLPGKTGQPCLLLGDGPDRFAFLCLAGTDSLGRIREILITNDSRYDCEPV
ncbi:MAG: hypothetical protein K2O18_15450 [Oscillospiraceae bacterium]|nr:hypothetical protein [Oscillospiraceae bacterium]